MQHFSAQLPVSFFQEDDQVVAYCPVLDLSTAGDTVEEAKKNFGQASSLFFEELLKAGNLGDVLKELGWQKKQKQWQPPTLVAQTTELVTV